MSPVRLAGAAIAFLLLAGLASTGAFDALDHAVTVSLQHAAPGPDWPARVLTLLVDAEVLIPAVAVAGVVLYVRDPARGRAALWLAAGLGVVSVLAVLLKDVVPSPGPPVPLQRAGAGPAITLLPLRTPFSFPSGHTTRTTFLAGTLLRRWPIPAGALVLCVMAALVYLGDHWFVDVLGGLCLGWICVELARHLWPTIVPLLNCRRG
jgi:membrane-associated phospholipid phosphatase